MVMRVGHIGLHSAGEDGDASDALFRVEGGGRAGEADEAVFGGGIGGSCGMLGRVIFLACGMREERKTNRL
jgi:hypothetical protein